VRAAELGVESATEEKVECCFSSFFSSFGVAVICRTAQRRRTTSLSACGAGM
jgi:hypothetical protein